MALAETYRDSEDSLVVWANNFINLESGIKWTLSGHEYLRQIYEDTSKKIVIEKSSQMGISVWAILKAIHGCVYKFPLGVIYFFPTDSDVSDFSKGRIAPIINTNKIIRDQAKNTDAVGIKLIGKSWLYLRGMKSKIGMKSVPADMVVFDELDECDPNAMDIARERISHSDHKIEVQISTPSLPGYGIDRDFQLSDQMTLLIKCDGCNKWIHLVDLFPVCIVGDNYQCSCGKNLDKSTATWVAKYPGRETRGYHISQLYSSLVSPSDLLKKYNAAISKAEFYRSAIGIPYVEAEDQLTYNCVAACCGTNGMDKSSQIDTVIGVDVGSDLHVVILQVKTNRVIWFGTVKDFESIDAMMGRYKVRMLIVDALPETRKARELISRYPRIGWISFYADSANGGSVWHDDTMHVSSNRTELLDATHQIFESGNIILPRQDLCDEFISQICGTAKRLEINKESGSSRYHYVKIGADHYRHALSYAWLAATEVNQTSSPVGRFVGVTKSRVSSQIVGY